VSVSSRAADSFDRVNTPLSSRVRNLINGGLYTLALILPLAFAIENINFYNVPGNLVDPFTDANTYLAAGERLNAGHLLYQLQPGDRYVLILPGIFDSPLLSPPPIAVAWRPLAALPFGYPMWVAACWVALFGTIVFLLRRIGPWAAVAVIALSFSIGEQLAVANINAFAPAIFLLAWRYQDRAIAGFLVGSLAAVKLAPGAMFGWLAGSRRRIASIAFVATLALWFVIGGLGAGFESYGQYLGTLGGVRPTGWSVAGLFGSAATYIFLAGGTGLAFVLGLRGMARASFVVAVATSVLGTPALYASGMVGLLGALAPWAFLGRAAQAGETAGTPEEGESMRSPGWAEGDSA
jgi:hypothetical protein